MAIKVYRGGRTKLTGKDYTEHKRAVWLKQEKLCATCGFYVQFSDSEFDHDRGRGMSGSKRDDLDPNNAVRHSWCHSVKHYRERDLYGYSTIRRDAQTKNQAR